MNVSEDRHTLIFHNTWISFPHKLLHKGNDESDREVTDVVGKVFVPPPDEGGVLFNCHCYDRAEDGEDCGSQGDGGAFHHKGNACVHMTDAVSILGCLIPGLVLPAVIFLDIEQFS